MPEQNPKTRTLGGWWRLWIVLAVLWAIPITLVGRGDLPTRDSDEEQYIRDATRAIAEAYNDDLERRRSELREKQSSMSPDEYRKAAAASAGRSAWEWDVRSQIEDGRTRSQVLEMLAEQERRYPALVAVRHEYEARIAAITTRKLERVGFYAALWAAPVLVLLVIGLAVRWIATGFSKA